MVIRFHVSLSISGICLRIPAPGKHYCLLCSQQQVSSIYPSYFMHSLSKSSQGNTYTIKWMFGLPEVMKAMHDMDIHEGSTVRVLQKFHDSLIISSADRKIVLGNEVADRIQV